MSDRWAGAWVAERFGVSVSGHDGEALPDLVGVALRRNPRRAHLLVSTVLGKHVPTEPRVVHAAGLRLGALVAQVLAGEPAVVVGYAETATALGHCVAEALGADYLHSTRRPIEGVVDIAGFEEEHSHATRHLLLPEDPGMLARPGAIVLVDDELSTGRTALNTVLALHRFAPHDRYVIAALVDLRAEPDRARTAEVAAELGTRIDVVSLSSGSVSWPAQFPAQAAQFVAEEVAEEPVLEGAPPSRGNVFAASVPWPAGVREGGRHGFTPADQAAARRAAAAVAAGVATRLTGRRALVLGFEELMYTPLLVALELATYADVRFSTTTRSPVLPLDEPGYPIRTRLTFPAHDDPADGPGERYAYNVAQAERFTDVVLVVDDVGDTGALHAAGGLLAQLGAVCGRVHLVTIPSYLPVPLPSPLYGPGFGSYAADEVAWLLTDLSHVELEAPVEEREEAIQAGGAHYAESLPVEYQPSAEYQALFAEALAESSARIAHAVGVVTELVLAARGRSAVLVSLARAGTPIGILMRRWAAFAHGAELAHYAVSIVRGRGIDRIALRYLAAHHHPADIMFVDGWTGKGAIARELSEAVGATDMRFSSELAVLADTGSCVSLYGTREDFLIPSACLNSTVSGLVSRTVLNDAFISPGQFHGAKFYSALAAADVSADFLDAVSSQFASVAAAVAIDWPAVRDADRAPTWAGWAAVESISAEYGIGNVNLVKPGVGEATRVMLRRVPWRVLVRPGAEAELRHVLLLAEQRGVPVEAVEGLPYSCVGLIHPSYTRGATGADGRGAESA